MYINALLVDIFDTYDKSEAGLVDASQLDMRINLLKTGMMKLPIGKMLWNLWKPTRSNEFIDWFELQLFEGEEIEGFDLRESDASKQFR